MKKIFFVPGFVAVLFILSCSVASAHYNHYQYQNNYQYQNQRYYNYQGYQQYPQYSNYFTRYSYPVYYYCPQGYYMVNNLCYRSYQNYWYGY